MKQPVKVQLQLWLSESLVSQMLFNASLFYFLSVEPRNNLSKYLLFSVYTTAAMYLCLRFIKFKEIIFFTLH